ncbi:2OG-Fe(II) oxygenase [Oceanibacterium hippocampi]|uniref:Fe2OG dioxygenase domain-containing protein n=1 Tax=Oceanibacterium hippocampi TaxID=745714 RepID=A0A1Y5SFF9_9PROT|nr:2OG-Fe(II) oxygenase [Oceanibacterium hippocampi]SLN39603.1 hypothetical protein OCH7691_01654 [Oceanibacterium hippocampi]
MNKQQTDSVPDSSALAAGDLAARVETAIGERGAALVPAMLDSTTCRDIVGLYGDDARFRSRIEMARHAYGLGDYAYFDYPLPPVVAALRTRLYAALVPVANRMMAALGRETRYPDRLEDFLERCHAAGQARPTPLVLHYRTGGHNRLHRDLYGPTVFPLQAVIMLSAPETDFTGGEFVLVENRPRQQALCSVWQPGQGDMIVFPVADRPVPGKRGMMTASMRHGVSPLKSGERWTLGIILHDAA